MKTKLGHVEITAFLTEEVLTVEYSYTEQTHPEYADMHPTDIMNIFDHPNFVPSLYEVEIITELSVEDLEIAKEEIVYRLAQDGDAVEFV